jgi:hypothetical protein
LSILSWLTSALFWHACLPIKGFSLNNCHPSLMRSECCCDVLEVRWAIKPETNTWFTWSNIDRVLGFLDVVNDFLQYALDVLRKVLWLIRMSMLNDVKWLMFHIQARLQKPTYDVPWRRLWTAAVLLWTTDANHHSPHSTWMTFWQFR